MRYMPQKGRQADMPQFTQQYLADINTTLGAVIRIHRRDKGYSIETVARETQLTSIIIDAYEQGRALIPAAHLFAIGEIIGIKAEMLFYPIREPQEVLKRLDLADENT